MSGEQEHLLNCLGCMLAAAVVTIMAIGAGAVIGLFIRAIEWGVG